MKTMTASAIPDVPWAATSQRADNEFGKRLRRWTGVLLATSIFGTVAVSSGVAIGIFSLLGTFETESGRLPRIGTVMILTAFMAFLAAAHCIDRIDSLERASRVEYCLKHGLKEDGDRGEV